MKPVLLTSLLLITSTLSQAATAIDGLYSSLFASYAYIPNNISTTQNSIYYSNSGYKPGYEGGGSFGYKSNPLRYEGEVSYFNANLNYFSENSQKQADVGGYNNGVLALANILYDVPGLIEEFSPYLGVGIGYAWLNIKMDNAITGSSVKVTSSPFIYQGLAGLTYNFSENYALSIGYRYVNGPQNNNFGRSFQINLANVGVTYRYDHAGYQ
jgi:opacity protein-like surface antigen